MKSDYCYESSVEIVLHNTRKCLSSFCFSFWCDKSLLPNWAPSARVYNALGWYCHLFFQYHFHHFFCMKVNHEGFGTINLSCSSWCWETNGTMAQINDSTSMCRIVFYQTVFSHHLTAAALSNELVDLQWGMSPRIKMTPPLWSWSPVCGVKIKSAISH